MESQFERSTTECRGVSDLRGEVVDTLRAYVEKYEMGDVESGVLACFETVSIPLGKHGKKKESKAQHTAIILTPEMLMWLVDWKGDIAVEWALLKEIEVSDYADSMEYKMLPDTGIEIFGFIKHGRMRGTAFIGLGPERDADKLRSALGEAVVKAGGVWKR